MRTLQVFQPIVVSVLLLLSYGEARAVFTGCTGGNSTGEFAPGGFVAFQQTVNWPLGQTDATVEVPDQTFTQGNDTFVARYASSEVSSTNFINQTLTAHFAVNGPDSSNSNGFVLDSLAHWGAVPLPFSSDPPPPHLQEYYHGRVDFTVSGFLAAGDTITWIFNGLSNLTGFGLHGDQTVTTPGSFSQSFFTDSGLVGDQGFIDMFAQVDFSGSIIKGTGGGTSWIDLDPSISVTAVPEPSTLSLAGCGLALVTLAALCR